MSKGRDISSYLPMALRFEENSGSDHYDVYGAYKIAKRHYFTKKETALVESFNSLIRNYLARLNRKTKRYSKAIDMIYNSILLLFNKNLLLSVVT